MAKKNFLADFEFKKFDNLSSGLEIPTTNSLKGSVNHEVEKKPKIEPVEKVVLKKKKQVELPKLNYKKKEVKPLVHVVPTSPKNSVVDTYKPIFVVPTFLKKTDLGFDKNELALLSKEEKILFLAMRGWTLKVERRRNGLFHYATKYINRKKQRIYLGSINNSV